MKTNANDPINPIINSDGFPSDGEIVIRDKSVIGLTKREYFAAMTMQGLIISRQSTNAGRIAEMAVMSATCLIEELNKTES